MQVDASGKTTLSCLNLLLAHSVYITGLKLRGGGVQATAAGALTMSIIQTLYHSLPSYMHVCIPT